MTQEPQANESDKTGLTGILKLASVVTVLLAAALVMLRLTGSISTPVFTDYLINLLIVMSIATCAAVLITLLSRPDRRDR